MRGGGCTEMESKLYLELWHKEGVKEGTLMYTLTRVR